MIGASSSGSELVHHGNSGGASTYFLDLFLDPFFHQKITSCFGHEHLIPMNPMNLAMFFLEDLRGHCAVRRSGYPQWMIKVTVLKRLHPTSSKPAPYIFLKTMYRLPLTYDKKQWISVYHIIYAFPKYTQQQETTHVILIEPSNFSGNVMEIYGTRSPF